ncbi:MAG: hypothetical protein U0599_24785 [Vicinamibacteria bacterium]
MRDTAEARRFVLEALWRGPVARFVAVPGANRVRVASSPDGRWLASSGWGNEITLLSADGRTTRVLEENRDAARLRAVLFSSDSRRLATFADGDPETVVWSVDGGEVARLRPGGFPRSFDGDTLVLSRGSGRSERREYVYRRIGHRGRRRSARAPRLEQGRPESGETRARLQRAAVWSASATCGPVRRPATRRSRLADRVKEVSVFDAPMRIVSRSEEGEVGLFDAATGRLLRIVQGFDADRTFSLPTLDRGGRRLAWLSVRQRAYPIWDLADPPDVSPNLLHSGQVKSDGGNATFVGDGRWLATSLSPGLALWPLGMPWPRVIHRTDTGFADVAFTPDSRQIVVCSSTSVRAYPMAPDGPPAYSFGPNDFTCYGALVEPSGQHLIVAATAMALFEYPIGGGDRRTLLRVPPTESIMAVDVDESGRWVATASCYSPDPKPVAAPRRPPHRGGAGLSAARVRRLRPGRRHREHGPLRRRRSADHSEHGRHHRMGRRHGKEPEDPPARASRWRRRATGGRSSRSARRAHPGSRARCAPPVAACRRRAMFSCSTARRAHPGRSRASEGS